MSDTTAIRNALSLRRDVLRYLGDQHDEAVTESIRAAAPKAWSLFLKAEYCAIPLAARFRQTDLLSRLIDPRIAASAKAA